MRKIRIIVVIAACVSWVLTACGVSNVQNLEEYTSIHLSDDGIKIAGEGAVVSDTTVTISQKGTYVLDGSLSDGRIIVDLKKDKNVHIILNGVDIHSDDGTAVYVKSVKNLYMTLNDGTTNSISDASEYTYADDDENINAAIYSKDDLIIKGEGTLNVEGSYKDGITSKDDLTLSSGNINVNAADDGIIGKDSVVIDGGNITVDAADDGIHSKTKLIINDGNINIKNSNEGLESQNIDINGGDISVKSSDDGVNISEDSDSSSKQDAGFGMGMGMGGAMGGGMGGGMDEVIDGTLSINGGTLYVDAEGDGLDSNGNIVMIGGTVTVVGPTGDGNAALDYNGDFELDGGTLFASGSSGMAQVSSDDSAQTFVAALTDTYDADSTVKITDSDGNVIAKYKVEKAGSFIMYSSSKLVSGESYTVDIDGNETEVTAGEYLYNNDKRREHDETSFDRR